MKTRTGIISAIFMAVAVLMFYSCDKAKELTSLDVSMKLPTTHFTFTQTILKTGTETVLYSGMVHVNLDSILNANGLPSGIIQTTEFTHLQVTIEQPPDATFGWLSSMRATIADNQSYTPESQIGSVSNSDTTAKTLIISLNNLNIRPYLSKPSFYLRIYGVLNGPLPAVTVGMFLDGTIQMHIEPL